MRDKTCVRDSSQTGLMKIRNNEYDILKHLYPLTLLELIRLHNQTNAFKQTLQALHSLAESLSVLQGGQIRLAEPLHCHAVADDEIAAVERANVNRDPVGAAQAGHQLHAAADAAAVHHHANRSGWSRRLTRLVGN